MPIAVQKEIQNQSALASLVEKLEQDRTVIAASLFGSLSYDEVWKNSDIDMWIIMDDSQKQGGHTPQKTTPARYGQRPQYPQPRPNAFASSWGSSGSLAIGLRR